MTPATVILCNCVLTFGVPLALAAREYWGLSRRGGNLPPGGPPPPEPAPNGRSLPDCLVPKRVRERELA